MILNYLLTKGLMVTRAVFLVSCLKFQNIFIECLVPSGITIESLWMYLIISSPFLYQITSKHRLDSVLVIWIYYRILYLWLNLQVTLRMDRQLKVTSSSFFFPWVCSVVYPYVISFVLSINIYVCLRIFLLPTSSGSIWLPS